jgi:hypothetical protein
MESKMVDETTAPATAAPATAAPTAAPAVVAPAPVGTAELDALVKLVIDIVNSSIQIEKNGAISMNDFPLVMALIPDLSPAFANIKAVPSEILNLNETQLLAMVEKVTSQLLISDAKAQLIVYKGLAAASSLLALYQAIKA